MAGSADHATRTNPVDDEYEAAAAAEFDEIVARRKSRAAASGAKIRMPEWQISFIMSLKRSEIPDDDDAALELLSRSHPDRYTPEVLEQRRREHKELVAMFRRDDEEIEAQQAEIMRQLGEKGYVETTDEVDQTYIDEINEWTRVQWERLVSSSQILSRARVTTDEENEEALRNFLRRQAEEAGEEDVDYYTDEDYCTDEDKDEDDGDNDGDDATIESSDLPIVDTIVESSDLPTVVTTDEDGTGSSNVKSKVTFLRMRMRIHPTISKL